MRLNPNNVIDVAESFAGLVKAEFGYNIAPHAAEVTVEVDSVLIVPEISIENGPLYKGMRPYPANPDITIVPTNLNMLELAVGNGSDAPKVFGVMVNGVVRPGVVTARSSADELDITYLQSIAGRGLDIDRIDPKNPIINPDWAILLKQAASVQDKRVGAGHHAPDKPMGTELGHAVLATASLKRPGLLSQGHAVHEWTEGQTGIAGATTDPSIGLYDFKVRDGQISTREATMTITANDTAFLLKIPELDASLQKLAEVSGADLTVGLGLVAVQSLTDAVPGQIQKQLLTTMGRL